MRRFFLGVLPVAASGCMAMFGIRQVPLTHSSLDFNGGTPNAVTLDGRPMSAIIDAVSRAAEKRSYAIVKRDCAGETCRVTYKRSADNKSKTVASSHVSGSGSSARTVTSTDTYNIEFASRLFVTLKSSGSTVAVELLGVPVVNGQLSCPELLVQRGECQTQMFNVVGENTPATSFRGQWGVDISGQSESEDISGILAEIQS